MNGRTAYLLAIVALTLAGLVGATLILLFVSGAAGPTDAALILGAVGATNAALFAAMQAATAATRAAEAASVGVDTRHAIDGRLTELLELTRIASHAAGRLERDREARLTDDPGRYP